MTKQRKKKKSARRKKRELVTSVRKIMTGLAAAGVMVYLLYVILTSQFLQVKQIIVQGCNHLKPETIVKIAGIEKGSSMLFLSYENIRKAILKNPWVMDAEVMGKLPSTVVITVREETPVANYKYTGKWYLVDERGSVFVEGKMANLPVIGASTSTDDLSVATALILFLHARGWSPGVVNVEYRRVAFSLPSHNLDRVVFPLSPGKWEQALSRFNTVLRIARERNLKLREVYLNFEKTGLLKIRG